MVRIRQIFENIDFKAIAENPDFKEDSVREVIILPVLKALGYRQENIVRSKTLEHPFLKTGSNKKIPVKLVPDYILKVENNFAWTLEAKAPNRRIVNDESVEQVYSYAVHPEIRTIYFALCNGVEFSLFRTSNPRQPILFFSIADIENHWKMLTMYLSPDSFQTGKNFTCEIPKKQQQFDYANRRLLEEIPVKKQAAKRHFGCNAYFTRQTWNVVAQYIKISANPEIWYLTLSVVAELLR